jgi:hypothetical protein
MNEIIELTNSLHSISNNESDSLSVPTPPLNIATIKTQKFRNDIVSNNPIIQLESTRNFRRLLSHEINPPIQQVIDTGVVPILVKFLQNDQFPLLQFEAAWTLTNIAVGSSDQTRVVIDNGATPILIQLLKSSNDDVSEQSAWALGNIAGDSIQCRDLVLESGALDVLLEVSKSFNEGTKFSTIRNTAWLISNLCRGKPKPDFQIVRPALPLLTKLLYSFDMEAVTDACWALNYLSDACSNYHLKAVLATGIAPRLVELLGSTEAVVLAPAIRTVGNIVAGSDKQTQKIIDLNILPSLLNLLDHSEKNIRKEVCWAISNITAGTESQIQAVIDANILPKVLDLLNSFEREAVWAILNSISNGSLYQIYHMSQMGVIPAVCSILNEQDTKIVTGALQSLQDILRMSAAAGHNIQQEVLNIIYECKGRENIEELQRHKDDNINRRAIQIIEVYF